MINALAHLHDLRQAERITLPDKPPTPMPILKNSPRVPSLLVKILSAMLAQMRHQKVHCIGPSISRPYPTHTFMRARRRKLKGWMKTAR